MKVHEYQAKDIFAAHGLPVPPGKVATTVDEAEAIAKEIGGAVMVKAQVHVGGRGKAGGVKYAENAAAAKKYASNILGMDIKGLTVEKVLITEAVDIEEEYYVGLLMDRASKRPMFIVSAAGGVDIEEVAATTPEKIHTLAVDPRYGAQPYQVRGLAHKVSSDAAVVKGMSKALMTLYKIYQEVDGSLVEINPFVKTKDGGVWAVDAKLNIDDSSLYRQKAIEELRDLSAEDNSEVEAREAGLSFVKLEGNVGCLVNGAGLAMATMDLVQYFGGQPANFLDIGGSSNPDKVVTAMKIILRDKGVKAILFNIFGGITRCDDVAAGLLKATEMLDVPVPIVVRLTGTNEEKAREMLEGTKLHPAVTMDEAVQMALELAGGKVMSIYVNNNTRLVVQGITGRDGSFHTQQMMDYGTDVVAGVTPGKGGTKFEGKVPIFNTVAEAVVETDANTSVIYVPAAFAADAIMEAVDAGCALVVCISEGVPVNDMSVVYGFVQEQGARLIGPNCPGIISPGQCKVGILPAQIHKQGKVGVVSRSGTLTYEVVDQLTRNGLGQSTCIGIGGDPIVGTGFIDTLEAFEADPDTEAVVLIGEIGGDDEEKAAEYIQKHISMPVVSFIAGRTAPPGKRMGHAGAIVSGGKGTAESKVAAFEAAGVRVADKPSDLVPLLAEKYAPAKVALQAK